VDLDRTDPRLSGVYCRCCRERFSYDLWSILIYAVEDGNTHTQVIVEFFLSEWLISHACATPIDPVTCQPV